MRIVAKVAEGRGKILYSVKNPRCLVLYFKDEGAALDPARSGAIRNKGVLNNGISSRLFEHLAAGGVKSHYVRRLTDREMLVRAVEILPLRVVVRNLVAGSLAERLGRAEGEPLPFPVLELTWKDDARRHPLVNADHVIAFGWCTPRELKKIEKLARRANELLTAFFDLRGIRLAELALEFGREGGREGRVLLADEISPDVCRLWEKDAAGKAGRDLFRRDPGRLEEAYEDAHRRVMEEP